MRSSYLQRQMIPLTKEAILGEAGYLMMDYGQRWNERLSNKAMGMAGSSGGLNPADAGKIRDRLEEVARVNNTKVRRALPGRMVEPRYSSVKGVIDVPWNIHPSMLGHEVGHAQQHSKAPSQFVQKTKRHASKPVGMSLLRHEADASFRGARLVRQAAQTDGIKLPRFYNARVLMPSFGSYATAGLYDKGKQLYRLSDSLSKRFLKRPTRGAANVKALRSLITRAIAR